MTRRVLALSVTFFFLVTALWYFFLLSPRSSQGIRHGLTLEMFKRDP